MQKIEERVRRRTRKGVVQAAILGSLAVGGVIALGLAAPNTLKLLKHLDSAWLQKRDPKRRLREASYQLKRRGLVEFAVVRGRTVMRITEKGRRELARLTRFERVRTKPKHWDEKWRIVIFDIPEKKRRERVRARMLMRRFGFERLQDSVWVYPYDCEELVALLKSELRLGADMLYIVADAIEYDMRLRSHFGLRGT